MSTRLALVGLILLVILLGGCGGGDDIPRAILGDYYPLTVGTTWVYDSIIEIETASELFTTTGTYTRTLSAFAPITVAGETHQAYRFDQTSTYSAVPDLTAPGSVIVNPALRYLFNVGGPGQPISTYYVQEPAATNHPARVKLVALSEYGGPLQAAGQPAPYLLTPPYHGNANEFGSWFIPLPLMPPQTTMGEIKVRDKVLDYDDLTSLYGPAHAIVDIYYFETPINLNGQQGQFGGRGRTFFFDRLGVGSAAEVTDWWGTLQINGQWARITVRLSLRSMT